MPEVRYPAADNRHPFLCPQYPLFRHITSEGTETTQYCPASGRSIAGTCSKQDVWYSDMCPVCPRLSGIFKNASKQPRSRRTRTDNSQSFSDDQLLWEESSGDDN